MSTEAQLKALSNSELASGTQIPALKHRTVNDAIIEEMYDAQSRGNVLSGVQTATSLASGDEVFVIRSGEAYLLDADELGFVSTLADLTDVNIPAPSNDQVLAYNFGTSKWVSKDVSSLSSVVSITGTATTNQMVKFTGLSGIGNSNISDDGSTVAITGNLSVNTDDFYVNSSNNRVGVGTSTPATNFQVVGNILADFVATSGNSFTKIFSMDQDIQTTDAVEFAGVTAGSFVTSGGTSTDFVKGDGSLDGTTYQDEAEKNQANGYAPLDSGAKIPLANLPDSILGQVSYQGTWAASTNTPTLANPPASTTKGEYYVASDDGTQFGIEFKTGDWIISNGTAWEKVDNTDAVTSVFGRLGNIIALQEDYDDFYVTLDTFQEISSIKNFNGGLNSLRVGIQSAGSTNSQTRIANIVGNFLSATGTNGIGFNEDNNIYFTKDNNFGGKGGVLAWNNTGDRTYTLPDASGTFAFTSDLDDYVTLDTAQTINGFKTFTNIQIDGSAGLRLIKQIGVNLPAENITTLVGIEDNLALVVGLGSSNFKSVTFSTSLLTNNVDRLLEIPDASGTLALTTDLDTLNASNITTGTLADARLSSNVALKDVNNNFSVGQTINGDLITDSVTIPNGEFYNSRRSSGNLSLPILGHPSGSDTVRLLSSGGFDFVNGSLANLVTIDNSGNVGIGTTPLSTFNAILEIGNSGGMLHGGGTDWSSANFLYLSNNAYYTTAFKAKRTNPVAMLRMTDNTFVFEQSTSTTAGNDISFTEAMRIDSSGNVGIGTSSPAGARTTIVTPGVDGANEIALQLNHGDGGLAANQEVQLGFGQADGTDSLAQIGAAYEGGVFNGALIFRTNAASLDERMRIDSSGNVGIGTSSPSEKLDVNGNLTIGGSLSKGSGSFKIDHPLPEKKDTHHLVHSFVEAPQADNIYRGKINLVDGKATVNIDEAGRMTEGTFVLLNGNVQCFTSNESGWTAIRGKVEGNILTIEAQDAKCTDTISWLVIGERIDQHMIDTKWTDENGRVITEPLKKVEPTPNEEITE